MSEYDDLRDIAGSCVEMVRGDFGRDLDYSVASLHVLDLVCGELHETGWHDEDQAEQWWQAVGCYTGETVVRAYGGEWIDYDGEEGPYAVTVGSSTGFPFELAARVLTGVDGVTLASFADEFAPGGASRS